MNGPMNVSILHRPGIVMSYRGWQAMSCANGQYPEGYFEYYAPAAAQISHALKEQFAPFLPTVITPLLHTLGLEPEVSITEVDGADEAG